MKTSESVNELAAALSKAQGEMSAAKKDVENTFFKSRYADLHSVWEACRKPLADNGLSVVQMTEASEKDEVIVVTRLMHTSGQWIEGTLALPVTKADAQGFGSAMTYARRYGLAAAIGVSQADDDGNLAAQARPAKALPRAIPANVEGVDTFASMSDEEKDYISSHVKHLLALFANSGDMADYIAKQNFDTEEKLALWSLLPSNVRSAIKKQTTKPSLAEQA